MAKRNSSAKLVFYSVILGLNMIPESLLILYSPVLFLKILNLIALIANAALIGALIREIFVVKEKERAYRI